VIFQFRKTCCPSLTSQFVIVLLTIFFLKRKKDARIFIEDGYKEAGNFKTGSSVRLIANDAETSKVALWCNPFRNFPCF
jgi:hypothetical protein